MDRHCSWQSSCQVHELHRLYRIQRELMSDLTRGAPALMTTRRRSKQPRRALNLQLPADEYIVSADEDEDADAAAGTELELTLAIGGRCSSAAGRRKNHHRRRQAAEQRDNAGSGGSASPFGSDCSGSSVLSSAEYYSDDGPAPAVFHALPPPPCQRAVAFDLGEGMMMRQHAPWLLQCQQYLSLRMT